MVGFFLLLSACGGGGGGGESPRVDSVDRRHQDVSCVRVDVGVSQEDACDLDLPINGLPDDYVVEYPECPLFIEGDESLAGCWVSELCAADLPSVGLANSARYLIKVSQDTASPEITGTIRSYYLRYKNSNCSGEPYLIADVEQLFLSSGFDWAMTYRIPGFEVCSDFGDSEKSNISCMALDIHSSFRTSGPDGDPNLDRISAIGRTAYDVGDIENKLCLTGGGAVEERRYGPYNFDSSGRGGLSTSMFYYSFDRDTALDYSNCLTRFLP
jgi:hypothetical protein